MRNKRPMRTAFKSPRVSRRRTVFEDTWRNEAASETRSKGGMGETESGGETVAHKVLTERKGSP